ncbi:MAG: ATP-dependent Clp protease adaptor ClpS [Delftia acidovorans]|jgi:ATP-dependent Clp protease adaptor protein ClpS|nr:ATP-dependent Clp protease adaptor ClpS [Delftia acidovorans]
MSRAATRRSTQPAADTIDEESPQEPNLYRVLLHNDDYTTMEFVVIILMEVFRKTGDEATVIMLAIHKRGLGQCGVYPLEIAETKVSEVHRRAREANFPLRCTIEEV